MDGNFVIIFLFLLLGRWHRRHGTGCIMIWINLVCLACFFWFWRCWIWERPLFGLIGRRLLQLLVTLVACTYFLLFYITQQSTCRDCPLDITCMLFLGWPHQWLRLELSCIASRILRVDTWTLVLIHICIQHRAKFLIWIVKLCQVFQRQLCTSLTLRAWNRIIKL